MSVSLDDSAVTLAAAVKAKQVSAVELATESLKRIAANDAKLNAFTEVTKDRALKEAAAVDAAIAKGNDPGPLAGVPVAVKNLFDVEGLTTLAGSKINRDLPPAKADGASVVALKRAGAVLVGALNMDEYAYGFTTENTHYGPCHNPHDLTRIAGGSSGGSAAAVAGGLVPLTLGSDTNGSVRVPSALCGIFGLKPTYGRLSRAGSYPFVHSLDHVGGFARSTADLAVMFDRMQGHDPADPVSTTRPPVPTAPDLPKGLSGLRVAVADGYFAEGGEQEAYDAVAAVAKALGVDRTVTIPDAMKARASAFLIASSEGGNLHLADLRKRAEDFDPMTRERLIAGTLIPGSWYIQAQRFRQWYRGQVQKIFQDVDIILAPGTPTSATKIGQEKAVLGGKEVLIRPNMGMYTQPISFIGLPVLLVPVQRPGKMPLGVQVIAAPYNEAAALRIGAHLEAAGVCAAPIPKY